ncbi:MAG TPA: SDR family NAD(P)-dependent oxidoreductase [Puia sp.]|jgi:NAD(P)-dependent dehydrogenase (short-subunit alcohol dehydrogenase family)|nr:SDR family NAD(P)-dependent oxidoreductase [Puia sp.]
MSSQQIVKTILVTGGTKGIGRAISLRMARAGYNIVLNYHSDRDSAEQTLAECRDILAGGAPDAGTDAFLVRADVSDEQDVIRMFKDIRDRFGGVDAVVNNAGLNLDGPALEMSEQQWDRVVAVNMKGVFLVAREAGKLMLSLGRPGHIINISASTAIAGRKNGVNYCASKAGVIVMTKCLAKELGPHIRVNCLIPGITRTPEIEARFDLQRNETAEVKKRAIPLERIGEPFEIAGVIHFLLSAEASYINGQKIIVDGGEYMY